MRDHLTKAVGLHVADEVWETVDRHLFADASGRRHGPPRVGSWWDFTRIPGRARSHTKATHLGDLPSGRHPGRAPAAYRHPHLPAAGDRAAAERRRGPRSWPNPPAWLRRRGRARVVVGSRWRRWRWCSPGCPPGIVVLPVRLPQGAGQWAHLPHFLADPSVWHKIDLVRVLDRKAPGGWRYYAHLLTHQGGYQSPATRARRAEIPAGRRAGVDANVSNLAVASFPADQPEQLVVEQIVCAHRPAAGRGAGRQTEPGPPTRAGPLPAQHQPRPVRAVGAAAQTGAPPRRGRVGGQTGHQPGRAAAARADGVPLRAYRHDTLSAAIGAPARDHGADARAASQAKQARAAHLAARIVATHGNTITVEDCRDLDLGAVVGQADRTCSAPACSWPPSNRNAPPPAARWHRAGTRTTAMSQHCLCGQRVAKTLAQRTHDCPHCGLRGDRDIVSAMLAACVELTDPDDPRTARVDYRLAHALRAGLASQQEWEGSVNRHQPPTPPWCWIGQDRQPPPGGLC